MLPSDAKPIPGCSGYYVTPSGEVWTTRERRHQKQGPRPIRPSLRQRYLGVCISPARKFRTVHAMVAEVFIGPRPPGMTIDHIDGNTTNNAAHNLEYVTPSENRNRWTRRAA